MDVAAIVASVGSFVVSERVIKAKATVLFGLLCTVCYDLFIHSNDAATLRVYRGKPSEMDLSYLSYLNPISTYTFIHPFIECDYCRNRSCSHCYNYNYVRLLPTILATEWYSMRRTNILTGHCTCRNCGTKRRRWSL